MIRSLRFQWHRFWEWRHLRQAAGHQDIAAHYLRLADAHAAKAKTLSRHDTR